MLSSWYGVTVCSFVGELIGDSILAGAKSNGSVAASAGKRPRDTEDCSDPAVFGRANDPAVLGRDGLLK